MMVDDNQFLYFDILILINFTVSHNFSVILHL